MLTTLASAFMTATRMDGFAQATGGTATKAPRRAPRHRSVAAGALAALRRLAR